MIKMGPRKSEWEQWERTKGEKGRYMRDQVSRKEATKDPKQSQLPGNSANNRGTIGGGSNSRQAMQMRHWRRID